MILDAARVLYCEEKMSLTICVLGPVHVDNFVWGCYFQKETNEVS